MDCSGFCGAAAGAGPTGRAAVDRAFAGASEVGTLPPLVKKVVGGGGLGHWVSFGGVRMSLELVAGVDGTDLGLFGVVVFDRPYRARYL